jgi:hypothetical protein
MSRLPAEVLGGVERRGGVVCPTCSASVAARYCGVCGERMLGERDRSFGAFVGEAASHVFTLDNRLWRTLRAMFRPGLLTSEYVGGRRRPYLSPVQLFLLLSVAFFLIGPSLGLMNTRLAQFERDRVTSRVALPLVAAGMERTGLDQAAFTRRFEATMATQRRFLILLAVPIFALVLKALYRRSSYVAHLAFSTHTIGSLLVLMFLYLLSLFLLLTMLFPLIVRAGAGDFWPPNRLMAIVAIATPVVIFLGLALRRVYGGSRAATMGKALVATIGLFFSLVAYEHLLFFTTAFVILLAG